MRYQNPVITGFYPDPSVCEARGKYYLVTSSFQYFPGVPLFESEDLINWTQIGHVLTRPSQVHLAHVPSSGGVFAPTIRYHDGRFYMVTTNDTTHENFYVWTDDIYGEWSDPITIDQGGIDPSLLFDEGHVYFISNGADDRGVGGVTQCEIDIATGKKLTESRCIWQGNGGRYLESPHMYHLNGWYYLLAAEGGTEYGHMVVLARAQTPWGPFANCPGNPILTNRNKAPGIIQGIGHGDLIRARDGSWYLMSLGFRQIHMWMPFHHLGREVFLTPVRFEKNGWLSCGNDGTTEEYYDIASDVPQMRKTEYTFENTAWQVDWCALRFPDWNNYTFGQDHLLLRAGRDTLDDMASPTFLALRQKAFRMEYRVTAVSHGGEGGVSVYGTESEHYDLFLREGDKGCEAVLKLNIGGIRHEQAVLPLKGKEAELIIRSDSIHYHFFVRENGEETCLGSAQSKFLSNEISTTFTGVVLGLFSQKGGETRFEKLHIQYTL
ncbi:MAG: family 43 glycosylhydrolase [Clostridia bacterium]|nr:family 43 glycosylhydrolase [Clostridia bacterium]